MGVSIQSTNNIPKLVKVLEKLQHSEIQVGVFGEDGSANDAGIDLATLARVHEYGMTITPKRAKFLTIPLIPAAKGKRAREFSDLFPLGLEDGNGVLARDKGNGEIEAVFALVKSVKIPERSFLRTGFDKNVDRMTTKIESMLEDVLAFNLNPDVFLDLIGYEFASLIQKELKGLKSPGNAAVTKKVKGSANPLIDTGRLVGAIRHKVK